MPSDTEAGAGRACSSVAASVGRVWVPWPLGRPEGVWAARVVLAAGRSWATRALCILEGERAPTTCRSKPFLKMLLWPLLFLGLADACVPREAAIEEKSGSTDCWFCCPPVQRMMSRLSPDDRTEEEMKILKQILGLLSLQVLNEESSGCKEEAKPAPAAEPAPRPLLKRNSWNFVKCAYMVVTFLFTSYNKGDWCYCHYCSPDTDVREQGRRDSCAHEGTVKHTQMSRVSAKATEEKGHMGKETEEPSLPARWGSRTAFSGKLH
ncbi:epididymal protein 13 isoform X4 [Tupaia chinensis]|uniref:epididymal protein 13 isoform X4 n=1 Tax=Tupaia chinensis TaxID=246437 RepID=UPI00070415B9|nr:epididymal protein 13 isoform X4 [Tupaia chinensis]